ncbi:Conserved exported protein of uncharacterised function [Mycobacterium tuberculosis]|nr:Conserved exported protein of uncharacterised function [Mycobacterium tuberculosis]
MPSRTRAPTTLLTAMAATVVIVAWIANRPPASSHEPSPTPNTQLAEQPLIGLGGGVTVRELTQDTPFSLVALTGDLAGTSARVRAKRPDGDWGPWYQTEYETEPRDPAGTDGSVELGGLNPGPRSTDPVFVGTTTTVQVAVTRPIDAPITQPPAGRPPNDLLDSGLGYRPATKEQPFGQNISAILISPPQARPERSGRHQPQSPWQASRRPSSAGRNGAQTSHCDAKHRSTTGGFVPRWSTTPRGATTTLRWSPPA